VKAPRPRGARSAGYQLLLGAGDPIDNFVWNAIAKGKKAQSVSLAR
jgi:hypothetical protein